MTKLKGYKDTVKDAADSLIEAHIETGIELQNWPEMLALVRLVYPDFDPDVSPNDQDFTVYGIEISFVGGGGTQNVVRISHERAAAEVYRAMDEETIESVSVIISSPSQETHAV